MNDGSSDALDSQSPETVGQIDLNHDQHRERGPESDRDCSKKELSEERINFFRVINTFKSYGQVSKEKLNKKVKYFESLPLNHQVRFLLFDFSLVLEFSSDPSLKLSSDLPPDRVR